jgi:hypothetical protein
MLELERHGIADGSGPFEGRRENLNQVNKLSRTYAAILEALNRHRGKGQQKVTVEHVHVHAGGQAVVGMVENPGGGDRTKSEEQPHVQHQVSAGICPHQLSAPTLLYPLGSIASQSPWLSRFSEFGLRPVR